MKELAPSRTAPQDKSIIVQDIGCLIDNTQSLNQARYPFLVHSFFSIPPLTAKISCDFAMEMPHHRYSPELYNSTKIFQDGDSCASPVETTEERDS